MTRIHLPQIYDDRYGYPGVFRLNRCDGCGHLHVDAKFEPRHLSRLYTQFYPRSDLSLDDFKPYEEVRGLRSWWDGERSAVFRWVPKNVRVLDIGCGFGQTLAYHCNRGCDAYGVEADENIRRVAERFGFKVNVGLFDAVLYEPGFFDVVTLDQVVEHTTDPCELLRGVARVLKPGGTAFLSTPNPVSIGARAFKRFWLHWHTPYHLQFFTAKSMRIAAEQAGLKIERRRTVTSSRWWHYQWLHLFAFPPPGNRSAFWSPRGERRFFYRRAYRWLVALDRMQLNHLLTRTLDALGIGDNQVFVLRKPT